MNQNPNSTIFLFKEKYNWGANPFTLLMLTMKRSFQLLCAGIFLACTVAAAKPLVTVTVSNAPGCIVPDDFIGLSFEMANVLPRPNKIAGANNFYLFSPTNQALISLFKGVGVKNLRVGGGTVDSSLFGVPGTADIDQLFAFAHTADVKVIYSFRLLNGNVTNAAAIARYIWQSYRDQLDCFAIGNEPDWPGYLNKDPKITNYPSWLADWKIYAGAICDSAPGAKFAAPDTGSNFPVPGAQDTMFNGKSWTPLFADDEKNSGLIASVFQHDYVGQSAKGVSMAAAIDAMLSPDWVNVNYPALYENVLLPVAADGLLFRMTECNDYAFGVNGASNGFVSALWALDYMHWWAEHGCAGVNFHNKEWLYTDTIYLDRKGIYRINPKAYGLKMFDLGGHGCIEPLTISNPDKINLAAYAVRNAGNLFVTIINKEHGRHARDVKVAIKPYKISNQVEVIFLTGRLDSNTGVRLGGAAIGNNGSWNGTWKSAKSGQTDHYIVNIPASSAAIVKFSVE